jgi:ferredoxin
MRLRVALHREKCRSFGKCMSVAPELFAFDSERKVQQIAGGTAPDETIVKAAKSCPYRVIAVIDEESGEQLFPPIRKP